MTSIAHADRPVLALSDMMEDAAIQCPFPLHEQLRKEAPVYYFDKARCYVVSRAADIDEIIAKPELFSNALREHMGLGPKLNKQMMPAAAMFIADPPQHSRTRAMVDRAFTAPRVAAMEGPIRDVINDVFDAFIGKGAFEAGVDLGVPVPMRVIARQLGVPWEDIPKFKLWSDCVAASFNQTESTESRERFAEPLSQLNAYMLAKRAEKKLNPGEDIISVLAAGPGESEYGVADGELTDLEFCTVVQQLLTAGNETTTTSILSMLRILAEDPALFARLKADRGLIRNFVEESLRLETPVQGFRRVVMADTEIGGVPIPKGAQVYMIYASANRDETIFTCPNEMDLERKNSLRHLAFGAGIHRCIGQMLARKELNCVIDILCDRVKTLAIAPDNVFHYRAPFSHRALESLRLTFTAETA